MNKTNTTLKIELYSGDEVVAYSIDVDLWTETLKEIRLRELKARQLHEDLKTFLVFHGESSESK